MKLLEGTCFEGDRRPPLIVNPTLPYGVGVGDIRRPPTNPSIAPAEEDRQNSRDECHPRGSRFAPSCRALNPERSDAPTRPPLGESVV